MADLDAQAAANGAVAALVDDDMARRQIVLMGLLDEVPAQAQDAIQHALQQGANAIDGNGVDPHPGDPRRPGAGSQDGGQGGAGQGGGSQGQDPGTGQGAGQEPGAGQGSRTEPRTDAATADAEANEAAQGTGGRSHAGAAAGNTNRDRRRQPEREPWLESPEMSRAAARAGQPGNGSDN